MTVLLPPGIKRLRVIWFSVFINTDPTLLEYIMSHLRSQLMIRSTYRHKSNTVWYNTKRSFVKYDFSPHLNYGDIFSTKDVPTDLELDLPYTFRYSINRANISKSLGLVARLLQKFKVTTKLWKLKMSKIWPFNVWCPLKVIHT